MSTEVIIFVISLATLLIAGGVAYLIAKFKAQKIAIKSLTDKLIVAQAGPTGLNQIEVGLRIPGIDKPIRPVSPKIIEVERELDEIQNMLEIRTKWPIEEREKLEARYDSLIGELVTHFSKEAENQMFNHSLTASK
jgi:hypothetical protein